MVCEDKAKLWAVHFLEAKQEHIEEWNEENGKCELMYGRAICKKPKG